MVNVPIGFFGLGQMDGPMVTSLLEDGYPVRV